MSGYSQFDLLRQRRFLPYFAVQALGAFNDNVFRQAIIGLLAVMAAAGTLDPATRGTYTQLAPAVFILPYFLFSSIAGQFAERTEKARLIRITTAMEIAIMSLAAVGFLLQDMRVLLVALLAAIAGAGLHRDAAGEDGALALEIGLAPGGLEVHAAPLQMRRGRHVDGDGLALHAAGLAVVGDLGSRAGAEGPVGGVVAERDVVEHDRGRLAAGRLLHGAGGQAGGARKERAKPGKGAL